MKEVLPGKQHKESQRAKSSRRQRRPGPPGVALGRKAHVSVCSCPGEDVSIAVLESEGSAEGCARQTEPPARSRSLLSVDTELLRT